MKLPRNIEQYKDFDEQEDYSNFADEQSTQNEHDTTRESTETCGSREILSQEQPSATPGEGAAGEGQQGGTLQGDVQGDAQEGLARAEAGQEVADKSEGRPLLWERGAETVPEDVASPTITTITPQQGDEDVSRTKSQSNASSGHKDTANLQNNTNKQGVISENGGNAARPLPSWARKRFPERTSPSLCV